ncbi:hypothetical protein ATANTOWER_011236 [Ataeniobius toweri]|uniref:Uncharacterized protein n=1 Tax=Ataeniobius toweri TaxID=208326 RepID=A0ABU7AGB3_9TELE|nr:hypothetical protein [Ataeniobius toweri]
MGTFYPYSLSWSSKEEHTPGLNHTSLAWSYFCNAPHHQRVSQSSVLKPFLFAIHTISLGTDHPITFNQPKRAHITPLSIGAPLASLSCLHQIQVTDVDLQSSS